MASFYSYRLYDKDGTNIIEQASEIETVSGTVQDFIDGINTRHSTSIINISQTIGGTAIDNSSALQNYMVAGSTAYFYDVTPHTLDYKLVKAIKNGVEYCFGGGGGGGGEFGGIEVFIVGGGGSGAGQSGTSSNCTFPGGAGGGGAVCDCFFGELSQGTYCISIGCGGCGKSCSGSCYPSSSGCASSFCGELISIVAGGGGGGGIGSSSYGTGGSSGSGRSGAVKGYNAYNCCSYYAAGGGGGASWNGVCAHGGAGVVSNISGTTCCYGFGGTGGTHARGFEISGQGGGGCGAECYNASGGNASSYGSGGGSGRLGGGNGCQGIAFIRYRTACGYNITGGCKYECGDYTIHCFTSNGTLTVE